MVHAESRPARASGTRRGAGRDAGGRIHRQHAVPGRAGRDADFAAGDVDTGLIARKPGRTDNASRRRSCGTWPPPPLAAADVRTSPGFSPTRGTPWRAMRIFHAPEKLVELAQGGEAFSARISFTANGNARVQLGDQSVTLPPSAAH